MNYYLEGTDAKPRQKKEKAMNTKLVIYIGELPPNVDQFELNQFILSQGKFNIESLYVKNAKENKSFAYVKFKTSQEAIRAVKTLHLKPFKNYIIKAEPFKQGSQTDKTKNDANLFVKNLPKETTPKDLYDLFCKFGNIISINLKRDNKDECLGYGYVNFELEKSAADAINGLNQTDYKGQTLSVSLFKSREKRNEDGNEYLLPMLLIKNIPNELSTVSQIGNVFDSYGEIISSGIVGEGEQKMGVVIFSKKEFAEKAVSELNGKPIPGNDNILFDLSLSPMDNEIIEKIKKSKQEEKKKKYEGCNLVVKNLPPEILDRELFEVFRKYGEIASARVATAGTMKEIKNKEGEVIDKAFVYMSKGHGFVLFKHPEDAKKAKEELNDKETEYKEIKFKPSIEYYDYSKGEKTKIAEIQNNMKGNSHYQQGQRGGYKQKKQFNNNNGNYTKHNKNRQVNNPPNRFDNQQQMYNNKVPIMNQPQNAFPPQMPQPLPQKQLEEKITVESENLVGKVKEILKIENTDDRTEALGETLFYFLLKFIPQYKLNITEGKCTDTTLCSKLTGILIRTDVNNLLEIISNTFRLYNSLKDVLLKLMQTNRLDN